MSCDCRKYLGKAKDATNGGSPRSEGMNIPKLGLAIRCPLASVQIFRASTAATQVVFTIGKGTSRVDLTIAVIVLRSCLNSSGNSRTTLSLFDFCSASSMRLQEVQHFRREEVHWWSMLTKMH